MIFVQKVLAQSITADKFGVTKGFGNIYNYYTLSVFIFNFLYYIGYAIGIIGIVYTLGYISYKLWFNDEKETFVIFNGGLTKIVFIVISSLLLINAAFILSFVSTIFGLTGFSMSLPTELNH